MTRIRFGIHGPSSGHMVLVREVVLVVHVEGEKLIGPLCQRLCLEEMAVGSAGFAVAVGLVKIVSRVSSRQTAMVSSR